MEDGAGGCTGQASSTTGGRNTRTRRVSDRWCGSRQAVVCAAHLCRLHVGDAPAGKQCVRLLVCREQPARLSASPVVLQGMVRVALKDSAAFTPLGVYIRPVHVALAVAHSPCVDVSSVRRASGYFTVTVYSTPGHSCLTGLPAASVAVTAMALRARISKHGT